MSELRLHLVRHGETEGQSSIRYHGSNDVPLSALGREQIAGLVPRLRDLSLARGAARFWWYSPMSRAAESAHILAEGLGLEPGHGRVIADFREICFGRFEGFTATEILAADPDWHRRWQAGETDGFPDGEPRADFARRVRAAWAQMVGEFLANPGCGTGLVVAHRGIVQEGLGWLTGAGDKRFAVELGSVSTVVRRGSRWEVERVGVTGL